MTGQHIPDAIRLGQQVRQRRAALDLTAFTLAQLADVDLTTVNDIETGCPATKQKTAHVITALGCTPTDDGITPVLTEHTTKAIAVAVNRLKGDRHTTAVRWYRTAVRARCADPR
ncbi:hypothetical protein [Micromonospora echinospora]|uniref:hypothetical protein n=1 Tax=Micromonospora echinospora TaxID=1877 RepID=UPI003A8BA8C9